jgi:hypothetical protein
VRRGSVVSCVGSADFEFASDDIVFDNIEDANSIPAAIPEIKEDRKHFVSSECLTTKTKKRDVK